MEEKLMKALHEVLDPEYPVSVVDLGLVRGVAYEAGKAKVRLTFTSLGCPCTEIIKEGRGPPAPPGYPDGMEAKMVPLELLVPRKDQPRKYIDPTTMTRVV